MRYEYVTGASVVAVPEAICDALAYVAYASVNWLVRGSSLASSSLAGSCRQEKVFYEYF
jgi:hypothetical protein